MEKPDSKPTQSETTQSEPTDSKPTQSEPQPLLRVTAKNPKKVEAGRKGAEIRKEKEKELRAELRRYKTTVQKPAADVINTEHEDDKQHVVNTKIETSDWTPFIICSLGLAATLFAVKHKFSGVAKLSKVAQVKQTDNQLKVEDPFYMH